jgi:serine O-acetyltransferase
MSAPNPSEIDPPDFETLGASLLESYRIGGMNHIDGTNLPSKRAVSELCEDLLQLLFPGFHDLEPIHSVHIARVTQHRIRSLGERLQQEIGKSLSTCSKGADAAAVASRHTSAFLVGLPQVRATLQTDVQTAFNGDPAASGADEIILAYPFVEAIAIQRCANLLYRLSVPLLPRIMTEWAHSRTGIDIHPGAQIGSHFFIDHGTGVVIGETSVIGSNVKLYQGVSLIARSLAGGQALKGKKRHPTIEANVTIYAGTTIMGGDTIVGAGSTIGAGVFLTRSVPPRSLVFYREQELQIVEKNRKGENWDDWAI